MTLKLSHSSLSTYLECPLKYKYGRIDRIPQRPRHFFSFGKSVHSALEFMYSGDFCPPLDSVLACYRKKWQRAGYRSPEEEKKAKADGESMLKAFYKKHAPKWTKPLFTEFHFDMSVDHVRVQGYIDMVTAGASGALHVVDWKTGKSLAKGRIEEDPQLTMYQMAVESMDLGRVAKLSLYHVPSLTMQSSKRHPDAMVAALKLRIVETAAKISSGEFEPTPSEKACSWCDYKGLCPAWEKP